MPNIFLDAWTYHSPLNPFLINYIKMVQDVCMCSRPPFVDARNLPGGYQSNLCCLLYGPGNARFENREITAIEDPHDVLIQISYVGVCGSDVRIFTRWWWFRSHT